MGNKTTVEKSGGYLSPYAPPFGAPSNYGSIEYTHGQFYTPEQIVAKHADCFTEQYHPMTEELRKKIAAAHQSGCSLIPDSHPLCPAKKKEAIKEPEVQPEKNAGGKDDAGKDTKKDGGTK